MEGIYESSPRPERNFGLVGEKVNWDRALRVAAASQTSAFSRKINHRCVSTSRREIKYCLEETLS